MAGLGLLTVFGGAGADGKAGHFDFYVLALSWSPDYCAANGAGNPQQCSTGKRLGFVLHGLWPQYYKGYPSSCTAEQLPSAAESRFTGLYPSEELFQHEWEKHGTCSGLTPEQYLSFSKKLKESIVVPAELQAPARPVRMNIVQFKRAFVAANAGLSDPALAVFCSGSGRFLKEVFVCFSREGRPVACSQELQRRSARSCRQPDFLVRNVR